MVAACIPLVLALVHGLGWLPLEPLQRLDWAWSDARMRLTLKAEPDDRVVIVDIDERSLAEVGRWPWRRDRMAELTERLFAGGASLVGFDVLFAEPDPTAAQIRSLQQQAGMQPPQVRAALERLAPLLDHDRRFAQALHGQPVVLGYYFTSDRQGHIAGRLPPPVWPPEALQGCPIRMTHWDGYGANLPELAAAAGRGGFFNSITDGDGVVRALPLVAQFEGQVYESLALAMYRLHAGITAVRPGFAPGAAPQAGHPQRPCVLDHLVLAADGWELAVPTDDRGALPVPFRGPGGAAAGTFRYVSAADVLAQRLPGGALADKLVLVGATAPGIVDFRAVPIQAVYPGIEVHANALVALLDGRFLVPPPGGAALELLLTAVVGGALIWAMPRMRAHLAILLGLTTVAALVALNVVGAAWGGVQLGMAVPLVGIGGAFLVDVVLGYVRASRSRRELVSLFGSYVPREVVREMVQNPERYNMHARSEELTVMFCDLRGFTEISERLSPEDLQRLLNHVFSVLTEIIGAHRGTVDKYMGDCVMAFWGAPVESPLHAELAVRAAMQMAQALDRINHGPVAAQLGLVDSPISLGIGLNTGHMAVGDMGSVARRSYTVIGDAVNLASRLEGLCKVYGTAVVVSATTQAMVPQVVWQALDRVRVKGKSRAIDIFTPRVLVEQATPALQAELQCWEAFLQAWRSRDWAQAQTALAQAQTHQPAFPLYALYAARLAEFQRNPPPEDWDGVTQFESK